MAMNVPVLNGIAAPVVPAGEGVVSAVGDILTATPNPNLFKSIPTTMILLLHPDSASSHKSNRASP